MRELRIFKLITLAIILIFIAIFINNQVLKLKNDNKELLRKISILEKERVYYENLLVKKVSLSELETRARKIGFLYPENILEITINNGKIIALKKEKYFISTYKDLSFNIKP